MANWVDEQRVFVLKNKALRARHVIFLFFLSVTIFTQDRGYYYNTMLKNGTIITYEFIMCRVNMSFFGRFIFHSGGVWLYGGMYHTTTMCTKTY